MKIFRTALLLALSGFAAAQTTRTWEQSKYEDFAKGTSKGVAIRSDGTLELAPELKALATTPSTFIWSAASNAQGDLFAAAGAPARLYRITPDGRVTVVLSPPELQVQAVVCAPDGTIYAATSPDGKVYKIQRGTPKPAPNSAEKPEPKGEARRQETKPAEGKTEIKAEPDPGYVSNVFFEPKTKYIWSLALDPAGNLYVATGDHGEIFRVDRSGAGSVFFSSDETHIRSLAIDRAGNLIAGSDGSGLIYRISPKGEGFVLYSANKKEITALAVGPVGVIYAAGAGDKKLGAQPQTLPLVPPVAPPTSVISSVTAGATTITPIPVQSVPVPGFGATGSEIYRIDSDGTPHRIWTSREDLVYSLRIDSTGRLLAGTGNKGRVFAIFGNGNYTDLLKVSANQVAGFAPAPGGGLYAASSNLGKVFLIRDSGSREATFDSDVFDGKMLSQWGRIEVSKQGNVEILTRAGNVDNPDRNWSPWAKLDLTKDTPVASPAARFLQWRAVLRSGNPAPELDSVRLNYLPRNIAPEIEDVTVFVGSRFASTPRTTAEVMAAANRDGSSISRSESTPSPTREQGSIAVRWNARDDNDDQLTYSIYYRGENDKRWLLLKSGLADRFYSFDSDLLPDGAYVMKVVASDAPSHSPGSALSASRESSRFEVDNTPPAITNLAARVEGSSVHVTFRAEDSQSVLRRAEFSVDAGEWQFVAPTGQISDAKSESYDFVAPLPREAADGSSGQEEHVIVVRVFDRAENMGMAKAITGAPAR